MKKDIKIKYSEDFKNSKILNYTARKESNYGIFSAPYFSVFGLNTTIYSVNLRIQSKYGKHGPEKIPYLDTFSAMLLQLNLKSQIIFQEDFNFLLIFSLHLRLEEFVQEYQKWS